jgi:serine/threonine protein phosphatase PrpC
MPLANEEAPADTELEWLDAGGLRIRGVSARGHEHRYVGEPRQDAMAFGDLGDWTWAAVADGVGSRPQSHRGARLATALAVSSRELLTQAEQALDSLGGEALVTAGSISSVMEQEARRLGLEPIDFACTLVVAAVKSVTGPDGTAVVRSVVWQIGDSVVGLLRDGSLEILGEQHDGEEVISTSTDALPGSLAARRWTVDVQAGDTVILMTDGVANIPNGDYWSDLKELWASDAPMPAALLEVVDASVKSFGDDRTFVGIRVS